MQNELYLGPSVSILALPLATTGLTQTSFAQVNDEIIVTAQRRAQKIQDVKIAVTAVSCVRLEKISANDITEIGKLSPNTTIEVGHGSDTTVMIFIHGVGQKNPLWGFEPREGVYVDNVYIARQQGGIIDIFDVERVEVLRGSQGTHCGRKTLQGDPQANPDKLLAYDIPKYVKARELTLKNIEQLAKAVWDIAA